MTTQQQARELAKDVWMQHYTLEGIPGSLMAVVDELYAALRPPPVDDAAKAGVTDAEVEAALDVWFDKRPEFAKWDWRADTKITRERWCQIMRAVLAAFLSGRTSMRPVVDDAAVDRAVEAYCADAWPDYWPRYDEQLRKNMRDRERPCVRAALLAANGEVVREPSDSHHELERLRQIEALAREFISTGLRNDGHALCVVEKHDKSDPHYRLCKALEMTKGAALLASRARSGWEGESLEQDIKAAYDAGMQDYSECRPFNRYFKESFPALHQAWQVGYATAAEVAARSAPAAAVTKRVRVLVVMDADGNWEANGSFSYTDEAARDHLDDLTGDLGHAPWLYRWMEADMEVPVSAPDEVVEATVSDARVPLPQAAVVEGEVSHG